jgi:GNAT superfamily N-acetyltransferase
MENAMSTSDTVSPALRLEFRPATEEEDQAVRVGLRRYNAAKTGAVKVKLPLAIMAYAGEQCAGGVIGNCSWNWLYIDLLWVDEDFRGHGLGRTLMHEVEAKAREMALTGIYLWTQSWQAGGFYAKLGYEQFVEFTDSPPGHSRFGFRKHFK